MLNSVDLAATLSQTLDSSKWHPLAASAALSRIHQVGQSHWIEAASVAAGGVESGSDVQTTEHGDPQVRQASGDLVPADGEARHENPLGGRRR